MLLVKALARTLSLLVFFPPLLISASYAERGEVVTKGVCGNSHNRRKSLTTKCLEGQKLEDFWRPEQMELSFQAVLVSPHVMTSFSDQSHSRVGDLW